MAAMIESRKCLRCQHEWLPRKPGRPHTCPKCKSVIWDEPKTDKQ